MKAFKPGDRVRVIAGPRAGEITTVVSELTDQCESLGDYHAERHLRRADCVVVPMHELDLGSIDSPGKNVVAPPEWLDHYYDGKEKSDITDWRELLPRVREEA